MAKHAKLSPSASERWLECPASIRMESQVPEEAESGYAYEGTVAHALGEIKASEHFGLITKRVAANRRKKWHQEHQALLEQDEVLAEMERHTDAYVRLLEDRMGVYENSQLMLEQRLDTGVDTCWGTSDAVIVSPVHVEIVDFKYGQGVAVEAEDNPQLKLYALGALDTYGDLLGDTEKVITTVHQPRLHHVLSAELTPDELRAWREDVVRPTAALALGPDAPFGPSEAACRWCPASGRCRAQLEKVFSEPFELPELMSADEVASTLARVPEIREWLKAFEEAALNMAYSEGQAIPGYKVVLSGGQRRFSDGVGAINFLTGKGYSLDQVSKTSIRGIGELEKLLGVDEFKEMLAPYITKSDGRPSLVPESDNRPSVNPHTEASKVFGEELL